MANTQPANPKSGLLVLGLRAQPQSREERVVGGLVRLFGLLLGGLFGFAVGVTVLVGVFSVSPVQHDVLGWAVLSMAFLAGGAVGQIVAHKMFYSSHSP